MSEKQHHDHTKPLIGCRCKEKYPTAEYRAEMDRQAAARADEVLAAVPTAPAPARDEALRDRVARVLGEVRKNHRHLRIPGGYVACSCGATDWEGNDHRKHVDAETASALLGVLADSRAEAWDEGVREARRMGEGIPSWFLDALAARNPYREEASDG